MAKRMGEAIDRSGMRSGTRGSPGKACGLRYRAAEVVRNLDGVVRQILAVAAERRDAFMG